MKRLFIKNSICGLGIILSYVPGISGSFVQPGRTWVYQSYVPTKREEYPDSKVILALSIEEPETEEPDWYPCVARDSLSLPVLDTPLAWLREEGSKIWVRPNLTLYEHAEESVSNEIHVLSIFLGYWYGNEIPCVASIANDYGLEVDPVWNVKGETEFLLYDFSYGRGEGYEWPWSGVYFDFPEVDNIFLPQGGMYVTNIGTKEVFTGLGEKKSVKSFTLGYSDLDPALLLILDGIGTVPTPGYGWGIESYVPTIQAWYGFFIAPLSLGNSAITSVFSQTSTPTLVCLKEPDGSVIYFDNYYFQLGITDVKTISSSSLTYDLHGRRVSAPVPGSIYIRDGKKFVAR